MLALAAILLTASSVQTHPTWVDVPCPGWHIFVDEARESIYGTNRDSIDVFDAAGHKVRQIPTKIDGNRYLGISPGGRFIVFPDTPNGPDVNDGSAVYTFRPETFGMTGEYQYYEISGAMIVLKGGDFRGAIPMRGHAFVVALDPKTESLYSMSLIEPVSAQALRFSGKVGRRVKAHWADGSEVLPTGMDYSTAVLGSHFYFVAYVPRVKPPRLEGAASLIDRHEESRWPSLFIEEQWARYALCEMDLRTGLCKPLAIDGEWILQDRFFGAPVIRHLGLLADGRRLAWLHNDRLFILSLDGTPLDPPPPIRVQFIFPRKFRGKFTLSPVSQIWYGLHSKDGVLVVPVDSDGQVRVQEDDFALLASRSRKDEFVLGSGKKVHALNGPNDTPVPGLNAYLAKPSGPQPQSLEGYLIEK